MPEGSSSAAAQSFQVLHGSWPSRPEPALRRIEELLSDRTAAPSIPWQHALASALRSLEIALRRRASDLEQRATAEEPPRGVTWRLHRARRALDDLAGRTEGLAAMVAATVERGHAEEASRSRPASPRGARRRDRGPPRHLPGRPRRRRLTRPHPGAPDAAQEDVARRGHGGQPLGLVRHAHARGRAPACRIRRPAAARGAAVRSSFPIQRRTSSSSTSASPPSDAASDNPKRSRSAALRMPVTSAPDWLNSPMPPSSGPKAAKLASRFAAGRITPKQFGQRSSRVRVEASCEKPSR